jgi:hypothetical protein
MSEELPSLKLGPIRHLKDSEKVLIRRLLEQEAGDNSALLSQLDSLDVQEMSDGGMGSLYFAWPGKDAHVRRFGRRIAELQLDDADGVAVVASLNVDKDGDLFELDIWKTNFEPVIRLTPPL